MRNVRSTSSLSWMGHKEQAKDDYQRSDFEGALTSYGAALHPDLHCPADERQLLLSNMVACRMKIGGAAQAEAAVENAKQCVAVNDRWAKGHVRLASAYIALGGHSNDACNALQRAMQLDPGNSTARQMLIRELRRDHTPGTSSSSSQGATRLDSSELDDIDASPPRPQNPYFDVDDQNGRSNNPLTLQDYIEFYYSQAKEWYLAQSDDKRTVIKIFVLIFCLYVVFGGKFGFTGNEVQRRGNYRPGNVYDRYHSRHATSRNNDYDSRDHYSIPNDDYSSYREPPSTRRPSSKSFHFPNIFDGSIRSLLLLSGIGYLCHRNGINPMQAIFFLNAIGGGRRRGRMHRPGFGGGFARRRWR